MSKVKDFIQSVVGGVSSGGVTGVTSLMDKGGDLVDRFLETKDEKREAMMELAKAQIELNKQEAKHRSTFVAGWRPFIGWVCGIALAYNFIVRDIMAWIILNTNEAMSLPPALAMEHLMTVLLAMLGLGGLRTYEKRKGLTK